LVVGLKFIDVNISQHCTDVENDVGDKFELAQFVDYRPSF
jgi:hypothetical protein